MATERLLLHELPAFFSPLHILVVGSTLVEYNIHHLVNKPTAVGAVHMKGRSIWWYYGCGLIGAIGCLSVLPFVSIKVIICLAVLGAISITYSTPLLPFISKKRLKDYGLIKITVLTSVWVIVTTILPVIYWNGDFSKLWLEILLRFLLIFPLCLAFDIRDVVVDAQNHIDTLPNTIGVKATYRLADVSLLLLCCEGFFQYFRRGEIKHLIIILVTAIAAKAVIRYSGKNAHNHVYLGLVDGIMLLYGLMVMFA